MNVDYLDADLSVERRVEDLLSRMTRKEKVAQLRCDNRTGMDLSDQIPPEGLGSMGHVTRTLPPREAAETINRIQQHAGDGRTREHAARTSNRSSDAHE